MPRIGSRHLRAYAIVLAAASGNALAAPPHQQAYLSFSADKAEYAPGESALLSWASTNTKFCQASGDWSGKLSAEGSYRTPGLDSQKSYTLKCASQGGGVEHTVNLVVIAESAPAPPPPSPVLSFSAADDSVLGGGSTSLSWTATDADGCTASGGWDGARAADGSETVGPINSNSTFTLSCSGAGGSVSRSVSVAVAADDPAPAPMVSLTAASTTIERGSSTTLSWSAEHSTDCTAAGGWSGTRAASGSETVAPTSDTGYTLSCSGDGGSASASVAVSVSLPPPTLAFSAAESSVPSRSSTTLSWVATDADSCTASGGWSGIRNGSGSEAVGPISAGTTFSLSCTGPGGSVVEMLSVSAISDIALSWVPPTETVDGAVLTDLSGFRIYSGAISGNYTGMVEVNDPAAASHTLSLASGSYFITMTALSADGEESQFSNEVSRSAP